MKKIILLSLLSLTIGSCGYLQSFVVQQVPNLIVKGKGATISIPQNFVKDKFLNNDEETVRATGDYTVLIKYGEIDTVFNLVLKVDSTTLINCYNGNVIEKSTFKR